MNERLVIFNTSSDLETVDLGKRLGELLERGDVIALAGELGCGKTWFTKGVAMGLGVSKDAVITSPSFSLVNEYTGRHTLFHMDVYRLENLSDFLSAGLDEYLHQDAVVVMEWADRWPEILPQRGIIVEFTILDNHSRRISLSGDNVRALKIIESLSKLSHP